MIRDFKTWKDDSGKIMAYFRRKISWRYGGPNDVFLFFFFPLVIFRVHVSSLFFWEGSSLSSILELPLLEFNLRPLQKSEATNNVSKPTGETNPKNINQKIQSKTTKVQGKKTNTFHLFGKYGTFSTSQIKQKEPGNSAGDLFGMVKMWPFQRLER